MFKRLPFSHWKHREIEEWLSSLAREGWILKKRTWRGLHFEQESEQDATYFVRFVDNRVDDAVEEKEDRRLHENGFVFVCHTTESKIYRKLEQNLGVDEWEEKAQSEALQLKFF
ncbi:MAG: DUF2812 domain-containing protein [Bacilli bacterium]